MRQFLFGLSFSIVFIVGCAVGSMQGSQVASAQASGNWECFALGSGKRHADYEPGLNANAPDAQPGLVVMVPGSRIACAKH